MNYDLLIDLHKGNKRQGPGGDEQTRLALDLSGLDRVKPLLVADVGCGTGCSTLVLAENFEHHGYSLKGYFPLPSSSWLDNYYVPLESAFAGFLSKHDSDDARAIVDAEHSEIALYRRYSAYYSYGFYIAQKVE